MTERLQSLKNKRDDAVANQKRIETTIQHKEAELCKLRENYLIATGRLEAFETAIEVMDSVQEKKNG